MFACIIEWSSLDATLPNGIFVFQTGSSAYSWGKWDMTSGHPPRKLIRIDLYLDSNCFLDPKKLTASWKRNFKIRNAN